MILDPAPDASPDVIGYACVWLLPPEMEIANIAVADAWRRRGCGTAVMEYTVALAKRRQVTTIFLDVRSDNVEALALYRRFGFEPVGVRRGYYVAEGEDAIVMRRDLAQTKG